MRVTETLAERRRVKCQGNQGGRRRQRAGANAACGERKAPAKFAHTRDQTVYGSCLLSTITGLQLSLFLRVLFFDYVKVTFLFVVEKKNRQATKKEAECIEGSQYLSPR